MPAFVLSLIVLMAVLFPNVGNAQVYSFRTPPPEVTAWDADWQINSDEKIVINGAIYLPTRETRPFDGQVMVQVGVYRRVPVYADTTIEPNSIVYVPVGRERMRSYERRRDRELAGTTGSRTPTFPVESTAVTPVEERIVGATGSVVPNPVGSTTTAAPRPTRTRVETIPGARGTRGIWLDFGGARWYSDGAAMPYAPDQFTKVGEYRGFAVYRPNPQTKDEIWVQVVADGPLAPYRKR